MLPNISQMSTRKESLRPLVMPSRRSSCDSAMMIAAAFMKPRITGCDTKLTIAPSLNAPRLNWITPTISVSSSASPMYSSENGTASGVSAAAVISEMIATGPVASWREEPHSAPRIAGTSAV